MKSDLEISKALALAIGWSLYDVVVCEVDEVVWCCIAPTTRTDWADWWAFDYRDAKVIWPIAERYNAFPYRLTCAPVGHWNILTGDGKDCTADSAAKAVALAVIGGRS